MRGHLGIVKTQEKMKPNRIVAHLDMDAFFASVEQKANPYLKGQPVIVSGDPEGRSVVSTCSYEARPFGVRSGMPLKEALRKCPQAVIVQGDPHKYIHISSGILRILEQHTPFVEPFSIDEAFFELRGKPDWEEAEKVAQSIKMRIYEQYELTGSIGIASNKLLAKLGSDLQKPDGLAVIREEDIAALFQRLPIGDLWGVGKKGQMAMQRIGVKTIYDLRRFTRDELVRCFGVMGNYLYNACRGWDDTPLVYSYQEADVKSMGNEYTLFRDSGDRMRLIGILRHLSEKVSRRLRKNGWKGKTVQVKIRFEGFRTITRAKTLEAFYDSEEMIYNVAAGLFFENWNGVQKIRLLGVSVSHLRHRSEPEQLTLIRDRMIERKDRITFVKDKLQDIYGEKCITWGSVIANRVVS